MGSCCLMYIQPVYLWEIQVRWHLEDLLLQRHTCFRCQSLLSLLEFIYLIEVLSVMIQVTYFKKTGGKRIFKMAPIHHHFELCGWSETRVVAVFSIITAILCLIALMAM